MVLLKTGESGKLSKFENKKTAKVNVLMYLSLMEDDMKKFIDYAVSL